MLDVLDYVIAGTSHFPGAMLSVSSARAKAGTPP